MEGYRNRDKSEFCCTQIALTMPKTDYTEEGLKSGRKKQREPKVVVFLDKGLNPGPPT